MVDLARERDMSFPALVEIVEDLLTSNLSLLFHRRVKVEYIDDRIRAWIYKEKTTEEIHFSRLPKYFIRNIGDLLPIYISQAADEEAYLQRKQQRHSAQNGCIIKQESLGIQAGIIMKVTTQCVYVDLCRHVGVMNRDHFVPGERYNIGQARYFYVLSVNRPCNTKLSRNSINFPPSLMKLKMPWGNFKCQRRMVGIRSIVFSDAFVSKDVLAEIEHELGEIVTVKYTGQAQRERRVKTRRGKPGASVNAV